MRKIALMACLASITACQTEQPQQVAEMPVYERTELVVMRQVAGYSDIALMSED